MNDFKKLKIYRTTLVHLLIITAVIILANSMILLGIYETNPVNHRANISVGNTEGMLPGLHTIDPNDGFTSQALGTEAARQITGGNVPLWNSNEGVGFPLAGEMQSAALFPPVVLNVFSNGIIYFHILLQIIAAIFTYLLLKKLHISSFVSVVLGISFGLSGVFVWLQNAAYNPVAFLPVLLYALESMYLQKQKDKKPYWIIFALALAASIYSGFPETVYLYAFLVIGWAVIRFFDLEKKQRMIFAKKVFIAGTCGLLLSAPILVLFGYNLTLSETGSHGAGLESYGLSLYSLVALFVPYVYGPIFWIINDVKESALIMFWANVGAYLFTSASVLALFALLVKKQNSKLIIFMFALLVFTLLRMYGFEPFIALSNLIPGISYVAFYRYAIPMVVFIVIILSAFGIENTYTMGFKQRRWYILFLGLSFIALVSLLLYAKGLIVELPLTLDVKKLIVFSVLLSAGSLVAIFVALFISKKYRRQLLSLIILIEAFVLFMIPQFSVKNVGVIDLEPVKFLQSNLTYDRFFTLGPIAPNYGSYFDIASINHNDLPVPKKWAEYIVENLNSNADVISFTGDHVLNPLGPSSKEEFFKNIQNYKELSVKYLVAPVGFISDAEQSRYQLNKVLQSDVAEIFEIDRSKPYFEVINGECDINVISKTEVVTNCEGSSTMVRRELLLDGWSTNIGNLKPYGPNDIFQLVELPKGENRVIFTYNPPYYKYSLVLFMVGAGAVGYGFIRWYNFRKKRD